MLQSRRATGPAYSRSWPATASPASCSARLPPGTRCASSAASRTLLSESRTTLHRLWSETTWQMQTLRDNPESAQQEYDRILDADDPGLSPRLTFDPAEDVAAPFVARGAPARHGHPPRAGGNGQVEMAAAFDRAGFASIDVHMSDVIAGRASLADFEGFVACGGFSYGDVLGGGEGWAKSILFNPRARDEFAGLLRPAGQLRPRRLQRLPDDERARTSSSRAPRTGRASSRTAPSSSRRGWCWWRSRRAPRSSSRAWPEAGSRWPPPTARAAPSSTRGQRARGGARRDALRRRPGRADRDLPAQSERLAARDHRRSRPPTGASRSSCPTPSGSSARCRCPGIPTAGARTAPGCACSATPACGSADDYRLISTAFVVTQYLASMLAFSHFGRDAGVPQVAEEALGHLGEVRLVADPVPVGDAHAEAARPRPRR